MYLRILRGKERLDEFNPFAEYDLISIIMNWLSAENGTFRVKYFLRQTNSFSPPSFYCEKRLRASASQLVGK